MTITLARKALILWLAILVLAVANGLLRASVLIPLLGVPAALLVSGLLLSTLILGVVYLSLPWLQPMAPAQYWLVGFGWLVLTMVFEFSFGLWQGTSWAAMLAPYSFKGGNIWPVVLAVTALAPYLAAKMWGWR